MQTKWLISILVINYFEQTEVENLHFLYHLGFEQGTKKIHFFISVVKKSTAGNTARFAGSEISKRLTIDVGKPHKTEQHYAPILVKWHTPVLLRWFM